ncbi:MAG: hypothetical protein WD669_02755 [Pirellulales bacterium]
MSQSLSEQDDNDGPASGVGGCNHPEERFKAYFRFRPIAFCKHVVELAESEDSAKGKRDCYTGFIRWGCTMILFSRALRIACVVALLGLITYLLYLSGALTDITGDLDPNGLIALLTVVLSIVAGIQWWVTWHQLEISRLDQRPWLTAINAHLQSIKRGEPLKLSIQVLNTGKTPGKIVAGSNFVSVKPKDFPIEKFIADFEAMGFRDYEQFIAPPGKDVTIHITNLPALPNDDHDSLFDRTSRLHIICKYRYVDVHDGVHHIKALYTLDLDDRGLYLRNNYGSMD